MIVCFSLLIGPLIIFSNLSGFVGYNPVTASNYRLFFIAERDLTYGALDKIDERYNSTMIHNMFKDEEFKLKHPNFKPKLT